MPDDIDWSDMPEDTVSQVIDKIYECATSIRNDWSNPRGECRTIWRLCDLLKTLTRVELAALRQGVKP